MYSACSLHSRRLILMMGMRAFGSGMTLKSVSAGTDEHHKARMRCDTGYSPSRIS
jgi:hypothetical protein